MQRKGSQTQELTTTWNGRHRRAGGGLSVPKPTTNYKILRRRIYTMKTLSKKILRNLARESFTLVHYFMAY